LCQARDHWERVRMSGGSSTTGFLQTELHRRFSLGMSPLEAAREVVFSARFKRNAFAAWDSPECIVINVYSLSSPVGRHCRPSVEPTWQDETDAAAGGLGVRLTRRHAPGNATFLLIKLRASARRCPWKPMNSLSQ